MTDLVWLRCPFCGESTDLHRLGKPLKVTVKPNGKLHVEPMERRIKCGWCGSIFESDAPTMLEAMGYDGENDTLF